MDYIVEAVMKNLLKVGLVQVEVSARHVHLSREDLRTLFGSGAELTPVRDLSQPGQFLAKERICLIGEKSRKDQVAILGPVRKDTQVELSKSDCIELGVEAPVRESGDITGSGVMILEGPCGRIKINQGVIIAKNHVHVPCQVAKELQLKDKERVSVQVLTERPIIFRDVSIRVSDQSRFRMHIDFDEANAALVNGFVLGRIIQPLRES